MQNLNYLSDADKALLYRLLDRLTKQPVSQLDPPEQPVFIRDPTVYVAKTPSGGIPALSGLTPGVATCQIYNVPDVSGTASPTLTLVDDGTGSFTVPIYNLSTTAVPGSQFIVVVKDEFGTWWAMTASGGGGVSLFAGSLSAPLLSTQATASIQNLVNLTTGAIPSPATTSALNYLKWAGATSDVCLLFVDTTDALSVGTGSPGSDPHYVLLAVNWNVITSVTDSLIDAPNRKLQKRTTALLGKANAAQSAATDIDAGLTCT